MVILKKKPVPPDTIEPKIPPMIPQKLIFTETGIEKMILFIVNARIIIRGETIRNANERTKKNLNLLLSKKPGTIKS